MGSHSKSCFSVFEILPKKSFSLSKMKFACVAILLLISTAQLTFSRTLSKGATVDFDLRELVENLRDAIIMNEKKDLEAKTEENRQIHDSPIDESQWELQEEPTPDPTREELVHIKKWCMAVKQDPAHDNKDRKYCIELWKKFDLDNVNV